MSYYQIKSYPFSRKLCTIVLPLRKYEYQKLPMGLCNSLDIFQEKMNELFNCLDYVRTYIDSVLIICHHVEKLDRVLNRLKTAGFEVNAETSFFARNKLECLGYKITREGIMPLPDKVEAITDIAVPTTKNKLHTNKY